MGNNKEKNIRWALLHRVRRNLIQRGDNFRWVGFVRKTRSKRTPAFAIQERDGKRP